VVTEKINSLMRELSRKPDQVALLETIENLLVGLGDLGLETDLWMAQNIYFSMCKAHYDAMEERASQGNEAAKTWLKHFNVLGEYLRVGCR